jgi:hypothetical protein
MKPPFAQPEKTRAANVTIAKSRILAAQVFRILSRKEFGDTRKERPSPPRRQVRSHAGMRRRSIDRRQPPRKIRPEIADHSVHGNREAGLCLYQRRRLL